MDSVAEQQADAEFRQGILQQQGILSVVMEGCRNTLVGLSIDARLLDMQVSKLIARHCGTLIVRDFASANASCMCLLVRQCTKPTMNRRSLHQDA